MKAKKNTPQIITEPSTSEETMATAPDTMFPDTTTETIQIQTAEVDDDTQVVTTTERSTQGTLSWMNSTRGSSQRYPI